MIPNSNPHQAAATAAPARIRILGKAEHISLLVLATALPLAEVPKNLAWLVFTLLWVINSLRLRNAGALALRWNLLFAALVAAPVVAIAFAPYAHNWDELGNIVLYASTGWMLSRSRLSQRQVLDLAVALIGATLAGALWGLQMQWSGKRTFLELHSVGHVNHSAIYGLGVALVALAVALGNWRAAPRAGRMVLVGINLVMFAFMFQWNSRGALLAYFLGLVALGWPWLRQRGLRVWPVALGLAVLTALVLAMNPAPLLKTRFLIENGYLSSERVPAARTSIEMWRHHILTGAGPANFFEASPERVKAWRAARNEPFEPAAFLFSNHAHSVYFNTLAERGLIGLAVVLALGVAWLLELGARRPRSGILDADADADADAAWTAWGCGLAGFTVVFVAGLFNTTLHHEHGLLAMLLLGVMLGAPCPAGAMRPVAEGVPGVPAAPADQAVGA